jgi:hypothetical protein
MFGSLTVAGKRCWLIARPVTGDESRVKSSQAENGQQTCIALYSIQWRGNKYKESSPLLALYRQNRRHPG